MIWFVLSIPVAFGCSLIFLEWSGMNLLPLEITAHVGGIIILSSVWVGYRYHLWNKSNKLHGKTLKIKRTLLNPRKNAKNEIVRFLEYCCQYWTLYCRKAVDGTNDLTNRRRQFIETIEAEHNLAMPGIEDKINAISAKAVELQRLIDAPKDNYNDKIWVLMEWFAIQKEEIQEFFDPFLDITTSHNNGLNWMR
ncbi:hypothetical protein ACFL0H_14690 [Thermodesulfobacteriota bacterium]